MLKRNGKTDYFLPKHQRKIVVCLAEQGAMNMSDTNEKLDGENTSTTRAFHELERKGIVTSVEVYSYRGREFSKYWLTNTGIAYALLNGAKSESTRTNALKSNKDRMLKEFFEFRSISPKMATLLDQTMLHTGKIDTVDLVIQSLIAGASMEKVHLEKFVDVIKKSEDRGNFLRSLKEIRRFLESLEKKIVGA